MSHVVIIGNGISGITAARHIRKLSGNEITIISSESKYFFSRTALMYVYMGHMKFEHTEPYEPFFWKKNRINLKQDFVENVEFETKTLNFRSGEKLTYDKLIIATGSKPNKFGWPGQDLPGVQGLYSKQDLELLEENTSDNKVKRAVIVGGGLIGVELAEMLLTRKIPVTFLVREERFWGNVMPQEEGNLIERHMIEHHVDVQFNKELDSIIEGTDGRVEAIKTKTGEIIECELVGLTAGVGPNIDFLRNTALEIGRGIRVNKQLETNIKDVFSIGDCSEQITPREGRRPMEQVWYTGRMMGETVAQTICGNPTDYLPGMWFNSAKFFDIEYQTYGTVLSELQENERKFYWEHSKGKICVKMVYDEITGAIKGVNTFGIRMRHEVWERWINGQRNIEYVLEHLKDANFDPEFYKQFEKEIIEKFNAENGTHLKAKKRSWKRILNIAK